MPERRRHNVQGEAQKALDVLSNEVCIRINEWSGGSPAWRRRRSTSPMQAAASYARGKYLLLFDPLDGSSQHRRERRGGQHLLHPAGTEVVAARDVADSSGGPAQVAAGYAMYGPTTSSC